VTSEKAIEFGAVVASLLRARGLAHERRADMSELFKLIRTNHDWDVAFCAALGAERLINDPEGKA
jgi:hypothetical protein